VVASAINWGLSVPSFFIVRCVEGYFFGQCRPSTYIAQTSEPSLFIELCSLLNLVA